MQTRKRAADCLGAPALGVVDVTRAPQHDRRDHPGPEELPENTRPPLPAAALLDQLLHRGAVYFGARSAPGAVKLARDDPHQDRKKDLAHGQPGI